MRSGPYVGFAKHSSTYYNAGDYGAYGGYIPYGYLGYHSDPNIAYGTTASSIASQGQQHYEQWVNNNPIDVSGEGFCNNTYLSEVNDRRGLQFSEKTRLAGGELKSTVIGSLVGIPKSSSEGNRLKEVELLKEERRPASQPMPKSPASRRIDDIVHSQNKSSGSFEKDANGYCSSLAVTETLQVHNQREAYFDSVHQMFDKLPTDTLMVFCDKLVPSSESLMEAEKHGVDNTYFTVEQDELKNFIAGISHVSAERDITEESKGLGKNVEKVFDESSLRIDEITSALTLLSNPSLILKQLLHTFNVEDPNTFIVTSVGKDYITEFGLSESWTDLVCSHETYVFSTIVVYNKDEKPMQLVLDDNMNGLEENGTNKEEIQLSLYPSTLVVYGKLGVPKLMQRVFDEMSSDKVVAHFYKLASLSEVRPGTSQLQDGIIYSPHEMVMRTGRFVIALLKNGNPCVEKTIMYERAADYANMISELLEQILQQILYLLRWQKEIARVIILSKKWKVVCELCISGHYDQRRFRGYKGDNTWNHIQPSPVENPSSIFNQVGEIMSRKTLQMLASVRNLGFKSSKIIESACSSLNAIRENSDGTQLQIWDPGSTSSIHVAKAHSYHIAHLDPSCVVTLSPDFG